MQETVRLRGEEEAVGEIDALAAQAGGRVGLDGVLEALDRRAIRVPVPGTLAVRGFALDLRDNLSPRWWPQGITSSADGRDDEQYAGRRVVVTSSYSKPVGGTSHGSRITVFDVTDPHRVRYQHVLLVAAAATRRGPSYQPVRIHAGGLAWCGPHLHVAGTARGLFTFRLDDIVRVSHPAAGRPGRLLNARYAEHRHAFLLPLRLRYVGEGRPALRYSFLSLDRTGPLPELVAGEYGRKGQSRRLVRYPVDPVTGLLLTDDDGMARPSALDAGGVERMQGAVRVRGIYHLSQSRGRFRRGHLWVGPPGSLQPHPRALPPGPEDLCYWPSTDRLWSVSEHRGLRIVHAVDRPVT